MRLLLDTHVFLWYITADARLPTAFRVAVQDPANEVFLSVASVWEAVIKYGLGKLPLPAPPEEHLPHQRALHGMPAFPLRRRRLPV
jgi:PIN domain nuclease of toxin-antitoxin system